MGCSGSKATTAAGPAGTVASTNPAHSASHGGKAAGDLLTAAALKSKRRANVLAERTDLDAPYEPKVVPKTDASRACISSAIEGNILFTSLGAGEVKEMINAMEPVEFPKGHVVIQQGDIGNAFYAVESGTFDIMIGDKCVAKFGEGTPNMSFGELALLYNSPRAATVVATSPCKLWTVDRVTFRGILAKSSHTQHNRLKTTLRRGILEDLTDAQINRVAEAATVVHYPKGHQIITKGEEGEVFYIIEKGSVICTNLSGQQSNNILHAGDYFGERALIMREPRAADVFAETDVSLVALHRDDFENLLGHLRDLLEHNLGMRLLLCVPILAHLSNDERSNLLEQLRLVTFKPGKTIIKQGMQVSAFYIIKEGSVEVTQDGDPTKVLKELTAGQWFGETEVRSRKAAGANVVAKNEVQLFALDRDAYMATLGHLDGVVRSAGAGAGAEERKTGEAEHSVTQRERLGIPFSDLEQGATLGTGTFGRVRLAYHSSTGRAFALKMLQKVQIVQLKQQQNIMNEKNLLMMIDHPFVLKLYDTYKDRDRLYMLLELVQGGELFSRLQNSSTPGRVSINDARFYAACVLDAFDHLHARHIIYRDLKPENLLIDTEGYLKVVDFGFAKVVEDRTYTLCGTPEYLAPELVLGRGHGKGVDYWALGVLLYEMVSGYSPFADMVNNDQMRICKNILRGDIKFPAVFGGRTHLRELVTLLLEKDITKRLGCLKGGAGDVRKSKFMKAIDFNALRNKDVAAPWRPRVKDVFDTSNFDPYDEDDRIPRYNDDGTNWDRDF